MKIQAVVFDFGGVMTTTTMPERVRELCAELSISWDAVVNGFKRHRLDYDGGFITLAEMYRRIWSDAGLAVSPENEARILAADRASWLYRNERTRDWMHALKARGFKIGILTNMAPDFAPVFRETFADYIALADALVISGEEHLYKPQRAIYDHLRTRIGLPAEALLFVDDVPANCAAAEEAGWHAIRFTSNEQVEAAFAAICP